MVKRSSSEVSSSPPQTAAEPSTPKKLKTKSSPSTLTPKSSPKATSQSTAEKKAKLIGRIITIGLENAKLDELANETGLSKKQISDALCRGRNNLRQKLIDVGASIAATGSTTAKST